VCYEVTERTLAERVESDEVLFIFNSLGTPPNSAIQKYMNTKKVPQLFVATGATRPRLRSTSVSTSIQPVTTAGFTLRARQFVRLMLGIN
jgi:hypothetical protein